MGADGAQDDSTQALLEQLRAAVATLQGQAATASQRLVQAQADAMQASQAAQAAYATQQQLATLVARLDPPAQAQRPVDYPNTAYIEELEQAVGERSVSFSQTLLALRIAADQRRPADLTQRAQELEPDLLKIFQAKYGLILESRYAEAAAAGVVLLRRVDEVDDEPVGEDEPAPRPHAPRAGDMDAQVMWHWLQVDSQDATNLLSSVLALRDRITTFLGGAREREKDARDIALRRVYGVARELMSGIDREEHLKQIQASPAYQPDSRPSPALALVIKDLRSQLATIEASYLSALQRIAQNDYLAGMGVGMAIQAVLLIVFAIVTAIVGFTDSWLAAGVGGVLGTVLSVLQRMSRGLDLGPEGDRQTFRLQGLARPMIGLLLGFASYVLLRGGIVTFVSPSSGADQVLYYAGIAFLAGFSERFAQDMLASPSKLLSSASGSAATTGATPAKPS
jgi:hypothetical protein